MGLWTVVPAQIAIWGIWRLAGRLGLSEIYLGRLRLAVFRSVGSDVFLAWVERPPAQNPALLCSPGFLSIREHSGPPSGSQEP